MKVVGLGAQDTLGEAEEFVERFELTLPMVWDESFQSWAELGVSLQPSAMLFTADGQLIEKWLGPIPEDEVLALANGLAVPNDGAAQTGGRSFCRYADRYVSAHAEFEGYGSAAPDRRQRVLDDIRFASNAMAQTATEDILDAVEALAAANRGLVALIVGADMELAPTDDAARATLTAQRSDALDALAGPVEDGCGVQLPAG